MLGYSSADEALLRPHTNLGVQDAVRALQQYVTTHIDNQVGVYFSLSIVIGKLALVMYTIINLLVFGLIVVIIVIKSVYSH